MDKLDTELFMGTDHPPRLKLLSLNNSRKKSYSSISTVLRYTSNIAIAGVCAIFLSACDPLAKLGGSSGGSSFASSIAQCANGLPADLSGACRNSAPTMGALEVIDFQGAPTAPIETTTRLQDTGASALNISWSLYPGSASGYFVSNGPTTDTTNLASDLNIGATNFNFSALTVSYEATLDFGLNTGDTVYFRIHA